MLNNKMFYKCIFKFIFTTFFFTTMISSVAAYTDSDGHVFNFSYTYTPNESIIETRQYYEAAASVLDSYNQQAAQYITS